MKGAVSYVKILTCDSGYAILTDNITGNTGYNRCAISTTSLYDNLANCKYGKTSTSVAAIGDV